MKPQDRYLVAVLVVAVLAVVLVIGIRATSHEKCKRPYNAFGAYAREC